MFAPTLLIASLVISVASRPWTGHSIKAVARRQTPSDGDFPPECSSQCQATESALSSCTDDSCFCTATNIGNLKTCFQCIANLIDDVPDIQESLNEVTGNCTAEGFNVPSETLTGGGSSPTGTFSSDSNPFSIGGSPTPITSGGGVDTTAIFSTSPPEVTTSPPEVTTSPVANTPTASSGNESPKPIFGSPSSNPAQSSPSTTGGSSNTLPGTASGTLHAYGSSALIGSGFAALLAFGIGML